MKPSLPSRIFVTGIGTGVGKTIASAVLCEALHADYWKPMQCGNLEESDSQYVQSLLSNGVSKIHAETYRLKEASSPHYAAAKENLRIEIENFTLPATDRPLIVEGAGGVLVPINDELVMFDLVDYLHLPTIIVVRNYLGSINHTLLTVEFLEARGVEVLGLLFSGENYNDNEEIVQHFSQLPVIGRIDESETIDRTFITEQAEKMKLSLTLKFER